VGGSVVSMAAFVLFALPFTWVAWRQPAWALPHRIQDRPAPVQRDVARGFGQWGLNNVVMSVVVVGSWPLIQQSGVHLGPWPAWWVVLAQLVFFVFLDDFLYYWMHRAMHQGWLYQHIHRVHHHIVTPCAATGHYMHPVEFVLTGSLMWVGPPARRRPHRLALCLGGDSAVGGRRGPQRLPPPMEPHALTAGLRWGDPSRLPPQTIPG